MRILLTYLLIIFPLLLSSQDWIGIGSGTSHMIIKDNSILLSNGTFQETLINIDYLTIGENKGKAIDPETGEEKYEVVIEIYNNYDSIQYRSINGKVFNTYYEGNKYKRKYPFKFYSVCLEAYDPYELLTRYEINKHGRFNTGKYGRFEYNDYEDSIRFVKEIGSEIIDSIELYTQYLDIENMSDGSFPMSSFTGHCCDFSLTITDNNFRKYQFIGSRIPYHFKPIVNLLRKLKDEK